MRCISCMREIEEGESLCSFCGCPQDLPPKQADALHPGTELRNRFFLGRELGRGGFGITYIGYDLFFEQKVAIKEYYPKGWATRRPGDKRVFWENNQRRDTGCQTVIREAQKMNRIGDVPAAVHVLDVFYENNTAYIAMEYVEGITLKQHLLEQGILSPKRCAELVIPIVDTMIKIHANGIIHRDISPDNVMIQPDLSLRILDLGAAKDIQMESSGYTTLVARNGFSPREQYQTGGNIGPWTDVYALCATMYYAMTGRVPPVVIDRSEIDDSLAFPTWLPEPVCRTLEDGMRMDPNKRIADMQELKTRVLEWQLSVSTDIPQSTQRQENPKLQESVPVSTVGQSELKPSQAPKNTDSSPPLATPVKIVSAAKREKSKGRLMNLFSAFGKKKKDTPQEGRGPAEPKQVTIPDPNGVPRYSGPGWEDDDSTVLADEEPMAPAAAYLIQDSTGNRIEITKNCFLLGRMSTSTAAAVDCMIEDSTKHISRRHAAILFDGSDFYLQDISGKNITLLNGVRLQNGTMPEQGCHFPGAYQLYDGDRIQLAVEKLTFHRGGSL